MNRDARIRWALALRLCVLAVVSSAFGAVPTLHLPVRVYRYSFAVAPQFNCTMSGKEIETMMSEVNRIGKQANIHWKFLSVSDKAVDRKVFPPLTGSEDRQEMRQRFLAVSPKDVDDEPVRKVAIVRDFVMPSGGIYLPGAHTIYFCEKTPHGKTTPVVLAHEFGNSFGLSHTKQPHNLMSVSKPDETKTLAKDQIAAAREQAAKGPGNLVDMDGPGGAAARKQRSRLQGQKGGGPGPAADRAKWHQRIVNRLKTFDRDGDGVILRDDVPPPGRAVFQRIDANHYGRIDASQLADFQH